MLRLNDLEQGTKYFDVLQNRNIFLSMEEQQNLGELTNMKLNNPLSNRSSLQKSQNINPVYESSPRDSINPSQSKEKENVQSDRECSVRKVSIRSAHQNKQYITVKNGERLEESIRNNEKKISLGKEKKECKICLEDEREGRMIVPCLCSGSVSFAHEKCMKEWIKIKYNPNFPKLKVKCEVCHSLFNYKMQKDRNWSCQFLYANYTRQKSNFILYFIFWILLLSGIIGLGVVISASSGNSNLSEEIRKKMIKSDNIKIVYICLIFLMALILMFTVILFFIDNAFKLEVTISEIYNHIHPTKKPPSKRVHPVVYVRKVQSTESDSLESGSQPN